MTIQIGDPIPEVILTRIRQGVEKVDTPTLFGAHKVVLFAVPGAFTPTCSAKHLPGFKDHAADLKAKGVDAIACVSVNDVFVMKAWGKDQGIDGEVLLLADGNGDFTRAIGLDFDGSKFGMGARSQRYSLIAKDGVVTQLNVEEAGQFKVSSAEYLLEQL